MSHNYKFYSLDLRSFFVTVLMKINLLLFFSSLSDQNALDSEYVKRYLGELTPTQESRLLQLRKWIADLQKGKVSSQD